MTDNVPQVIKKGVGEQETKHAGGLTLVTGVGRRNTPATRIWVGLGGNKPGTRSLPHHHGEAETGAYVLSGMRACSSGKTLGSTSTSRPGTTSSSRPGSRTSSAT